MPARRTSGPSIEPITLAQAKVWARVDHDDEDDEISMLITAVRQACEKRCRRTLVESTWEVTAADWSLRIELPYGPLIEVGSVNYLPLGGGAEAVLSPSLYVVDRHNVVPAIVPADGASWPDLAPGQPQAVRVPYQAGYATAAALDTLPAPLLLWMRLHLVHYYDNRSAVAKGNLAPLPYADDLLNGYRVLSM